MKIPFVTEVPLTNGCWKSYDNIRTHIYFAAKEYFWNERKYMGSQNLTQNMDPAVSLPSSEGHLFGFWFVHTVLKPI